ncbi:MAG TPA: hypothetical protein VMD47_01510 [Candidatus Acidoferrales bacterium]|nr:hypothetical protein [Candidatus Acidoferrales bacterium]
MFRRFKLVAAIVAAILGIVGYLAAFFYTILAPTDQTVKNLYLLVMGVFCVVWIVAVVIAVVAEFQIDEKRRKKEKREKRKQRKRDKQHESQISKLSEQIERLTGASPRGSSNDEPPAVSGKGALVQAPQTVAGIGTQAPQAGAASVTVEEPRTLRRAAMALATRYRDFAQNYKPSGPDSAVLTDFWKENPFDELREMKDRLETVLGFNEVRNSTEWLPSTLENINKISRTLMREAVRVPADIPF